MSPDGFTILRPVRNNDGRVVDFIWVYENAAIARLNGTNPEEVVGKRLLDLFPGHCNTPILKTYQQVAESGEAQIFEADYSGESMLRPSSFRLVVVPMEGDIAILAQDITERKRAEEQIKNNEARLQSLLRIMQHKSETVQEFLDYALEEAINLTESKIGYIYFYSEEKKEFTLNTWSDSVMEICSITKPQTAYQLEKTGIWGEAVRQRKEIVVNDFQAPHPLKKGYPEGHAPLHKFLTVPVFSGEQIVAVVGVANKETDYDRNDVLQQQLLMDGVWKEVEGKKGEIALQKSEELFRKIFEKHSAVKLLIDPDTADIVDANEVAAKFYGWSKEQLRQMKISDINTLSSAQLKVEMEKVKAEKRYYFEFKHRRADGSVRDVAVYSSKIESGGRQLLHSIVHDITVRKRAEEELMRIHRIYQETIENANGVPYSLHYADKRYKFVGEGIKQLIGIDHQDLTFGRLKAITQEVVITDPEAPSDPFEYGKAFKNGKIDRYQVDLRIVTPGGEEKWISDCSTPTRD
ncbi:MAG: PAS domain S-box protein, partial [bacterium]|nr:PAS domain S-box protein [bacterium]